MTRRYGRFVVQRLAVQIAFLILFIALMSSGKMIIWLALFAASLIGAAMFGRFYCGYICPMNTVMRFVGGVFRRAGLKTRPTTALIGMKYLPWVVLVVSVTAVIVSKRVFARDIPILIILMAVSALFVTRYDEWLFHERVCPYGALLSVSGRWARFSEKVDDSLCVGCGKCEAPCPSKAVTIDIERRKAEIGKASCHQCGECERVCPRDAISYRGQ